MPFPANETSVLDDFDRADEDLSDSPNWDVLGISDASLVSNEVTTGTSVRKKDYWSAERFGPDCEVFATMPTQFAGLFTATGLLVRVTNPSTIFDGYEVDFTDTPDAVLSRFDNGSATQLGGSILPPAWSDGDKIGLRVVDDILSVYIQQGGAWSQVGTRIDTTYLRPGFIGLMVRNGGTTAALDDFGGGKLNTDPAADIRWFMPQNAVVGRGR